MTSVISAITKESETEVDGRVKLCFAILSCLGGMTLAGDPDSQTFALIAIFFAIFGYVFVDWLAFFSLPSLIAYLAMVAAAIYCVADFVVYDPNTRTRFSFDLYQAGDRHLVAVSQLLVLVQSILMLQVKTRRVCEQLCVFCLLELIVAAVFNNAITFGLLLVPIGFVAAYGLALLSGVSPLDATPFGASSRAVGAGGMGAGGRDTLPHDDSRSRHRDHAAPSNAKSMYRTILVLVVPAVLIVGATFFYAIPRTTESAKMGHNGRTLVGFSETVRLKQFGQMLKSNEIALRVWMTDRATAKPYHAIGGLYLRGRTLERYHTHDDDGELIADWSALPGGVISNSQLLPMEFFPERSSDRNFYDAVNVQVDCKSMYSDSLFAIAPYYRIDTKKEVVHQVERWTLRRREASEWNRPPIQYSFGTNSLRDGVQSELIARFAPGEVALVSKIAEVRNNGPAMRPNEKKNNPEREFRQDYRRELLRFNERRMPTIKLMADALASSIPEKERGPMALARLYEEFLHSRGGFQYTLNLDAVKSYNVDPIEKFVAKDRRGHCQYFASALAMMLRSQGIPARLVVGYRTDDLNELGHYYVARQSHAHAWVEALIDEQDLDHVVYGQPKANQYWMRLDPTPGGTNSEGNTQGVGSVIDLAQTLWKGYVVDVNSSDNTNSSGGSSAITPIAQSRTLLATWLKNIMDQVQAGQLGGGALSAHRDFSWIAAVFGVIVTLGIFGSIRIFSELLQRAKTDSTPSRTRPTVAFYAETLDCLTRCGLHRDNAQTPAEFAVIAENELNSPRLRADFSATSPPRSPLRILTDAFYRLRFGPNTARVPGEADVDPQTIQHALDELKLQVQARMSNPTVGKPAPPHSTETKVNAS
ncbi:transglutaminase TgpA family protein [Novipirellula rosea]|uniref:TransglutaminaseTgpA domain-containing protein n=1 Tax=Novipirellula rosea TaxID=1031540 RepID=A0ABP8MHZ6_9BACT|tara:strand:+ start:22345 stop:24963 length:2619 start_codon:yes stop_codon:yes gene_type:complete